MTYAELVEALKQLRCKPSVVARVLKLNPNGTTPGLLVPGMFRRASLFMYDYIGPARLIADHGIEAYRKMDKRWWKHRGCQKFMERAVYLDRVWKYEFYTSPSDVRRLNIMVP